MFTIHVETKPYYDPYKNKDVVDLQFIRNVIELELVDGYICFRQIDGWNAYLCHNIKKFLVNTQLS